MGSTINYGEFQINKYYVKRLDDPDVSISEKSYLATHLLYTIIHEYLHQERNQSLDFKKNNDEEQILKFETEVRGNGKYMKDYYFDNLKKIYKNEITDEKSNNNKDNVPPIISEDEFKNSPRIQSK